MEILSPCCLLEFWLIIHHHGEKATGFNTGDGRGYECLAPFCGRERESRIPHSALPEGWKIITDLAPEEDSSSGKQG